MKTYLIQLEGQVDLNDLNPLSPHEITAAQVETSMTQISICTDQAGAIGMLRYLHNRGLIILALQQAASGCAE